MENEVLLVQRKGNICTLVLNRPEKRNSLSLDLLIELYQALKELSKDDTVRAIVIRGTGDMAFSSGYDITAIPTSITPEVKRIIRDQNPFELAIEMIEDYPYPVIAMLNGYAFGGGCDLAVSCDMRIAADDIRMGMVPAKLGMVYTPNGLRRFIRTIGLSATKEMFFTGRLYEASRVKEMGLVDYLVPRGELESFTYSLAEEIAGNAPLSLKGIKRILNLVLRSERMNDEDLKEADEIMAHALGSDDLKEGQTAFIQKRKPEFKGK
jgi:enoyl-CoA hydratase/carnithine racemase